MPFRLGPLELVLILVIVLVVFGVGKLPRVGGNIGEVLREFCKAQSGEDEPARPKSQVSQAQEAENRSK